MILRKVWWILCAPISALGHPSRYLQRRHEELTTRRNEAAVRELMAKDNSNHGGNMVMIVGTLLFLVSFFGPMSAEFNKAAEYHYLPDGVRVLAAVFAGVVSGLATVIAYLNTGYTRYKDSKQSDGSGKTTITAAVAPPTITLSSEEPKKVVAAEPKIG